MDTATLPTDTLPTDTVLLSTLVLLDTPLVPALWPGPPRDSGARGRPRPSLRLRLTAPTDMDTPEPMDTGTPEPTDMVDTAVPTDMADTDTESKRWLC